MEAPVGSSLLGKDRIRLKCRYEGEIRTVIVNPNTLYADLKKRLSSDFGFDVALKYEDHDGDLITLSSQNDLNDLFLYENSETINVTVTESVSLPQLTPKPAPVTKQSSAGNLLQYATVNASASRSDGMTTRTSTAGGLGVGTPSQSMALPRFPGVGGAGGSGVSSSQSMLRPLDRFPSINDRFQQQQQIFLQQQMMQQEMTGIRWKRGEMLGQGAFGVVYLGLNIDTGELMAVKQMATEEVSKKELSSLENEINLLRNLRHPNIVRYIGTELTSTALSIFLEYVPGGSLKALIEKFGALEESVARSYTRQLLLGLEYLHRNGIAHRDVKGANCLVGNDGVIKLADFGNSKHWRPNGTNGIPNANINATQTGDLKGTPAWMAPEVVRDQGGISWRKADIWSLACTTLEMTTGKPPWSQFNNSVTILYHLACQETLPEYPYPASTELLTFLNVCFQRDPSLRPDVTSLLLHPFVSSSPINNGWGLARPTTVSSMMNNNDWDFNSASAFRSSYNGARRVVSTIDERSAPPTRASNSVNTVGASAGSGLSTVGGGRSRTNSTTNPAAIAATSAAMAAAMAAAAANDDNVSVMSSESVRTTVTSNSGATVTRGRSLSADMNPITMRPTSSSGRAQVPPISTSLGPIDLSAQSTPRGGIAGPPGQLLPITSSISPRASLLAMSSATLSSRNMQPPSLIPPVNASDAPPESTHEIDQQQQQQQQSNSQSQRPRNSQRSQSQRTSGPGGEGAPIERMPSSSSPTPIGGIACAADAAMDGYLSDVTANTRVHAYADADGDGGEGEDSLAPTPVPIPSSANTVSPIPMEGASNASSAPATSVIGVSAINGGSAPMPAPSLTPKTTNNARKKMLATRKQQQQQQIRRSAGSRNRTNISVPSDNEVANVAAQPSPVPRQQRGNRTAANSSATSLVRKSISVQPTSTGGSAVNPTTLSPGSAVHSRQHSANPRVAHPSMDANSLDGSMSEQSKGGVGADRINEQDSIAAAVTNVTNVVTGTPTVEAVLAGAPLSSARKGKPILAPLPLPLPLPMDSEDRIVNHHRQHHHHHYDSDDGSMGYNADLASYQGNLDAEDELEEEEELGEEFEEEGLRIREEDDDGYEVDDEVPHFYSSGGRGGGMLAGINASSASAVKGSTMGRLRSLDEEDADMVIGGGQEYDEGIEEEFIDEELEYPPTEDEGLRYALRSDSPQNIPSNTPGNHHNHPQSSSKNKQAMAASIAEGDDEESYGVVGGMVSKKPSTAMDMPTSSTPSRAGTASSSVVGTPSSSTHGTSGAGSGGQKSKKKRGSKNPPSSSALGSSVLGGEEIFGTPERERVLTADGVMNWDQYNPPHHSSHPLSAKSPGTSLKAGGSVHDSVAAASGSTSVVASSNGLDLGISGSSLQPKKMRNGGRTSSGNPDGVLRASNSKASLLGSSAPGPASITTSPTQGTAQATTGQSQGRKRGKRREKDSSTATVSSTTTTTAAPITAEKDKDGDVLEISCDSLEISGIPAGPKTHHSQLRTSGDRSAGGLSGLVDPVMVHAPLTAPSAVRSHLHTLSPGKKPSTALPANTLVTASVDILEDSTGTLPLDGDYGRDDGAGGGDRRESNAADEGSARSLMESEPFILEEHTGSVTRLRAPRKTSLLVSASLDGTVRIWSATDHQSRAVLDTAAFSASSGSSGAPSSTAGSGANGAAGGNERRVSLGTKASAADNTDMQGDADGAGLGGTRVKVVNLWCEENCESIWSACSDGSLRVWNGGEYKPLRWIKGHEEAITCMEGLDASSLSGGGGALSSNSAIVATGSVDRTIRMWDLRAKKTQVFVFRGHGDSVMTLKWCEGGRGLISGGKDKTIKIWDTRAGRMRNSIEKHFGSVHCLRVLSDPNSAVLVQGNGANAPVPGTGPATGSGSGVIPAFVSAGRDAMLNFWNASGDCLSSQTAHRGYVSYLSEVYFHYSAAANRPTSANYSAIASPWILSAGSDSSIKLWDLRRYRCIAEITASTPPTGTISKIVWCGSKGDCFVTASSSGQIRLFNKTPTASTTNPTGLQPLAESDMPVPSGSLTKESSGSAWQSMDMLSHSQNCTDLVSTEGLVACSSKSGRIFRWNY